MEPWRAICVSRVRQANPAAASRTTVSPRIRHQPEDADSEEIAADAVRDALQQCFEGVADQSIPQDMLHLLARAAAMPVRIDEDA